MAKKPPRDDVGDRDLTVRGPEAAAAGLPGVRHGLAAAMSHMGVRRTALTLLKVNQAEGFDCPGCAWPEPPPSTARPPSSARTAPRPWPRRPPCAGSPRSSSPRTRSPSWPGAVTTGWASRAG
ncbi:hypothetical protein ACFQZ4_19505 [Catellatospora coxensis]